MPQQRTTVAIAAAAVAGGLLAYKLAQYYATYAQQQACMRQFEEKMILSSDLLFALRDEMVEKMQKALKGDRSNNILMLPSMVDFLPNGHERGQSLAIDIGGTNMRASYVKLGEQQGELETFVMESRMIPPECRRCHIDQLFDWMAASMVEFLQRQGIKLADEVPTLGFCFSFPTNQTKVDSGEVVLWTKGFHITGSDGVDLVPCLEEAFLRAGLPVRVAVLINDTVGTLCASRYADQDTVIGLILGSGFNACYVEDVSNISSLPSNTPRRSHQMVINTECGGFHSAVLPVIEEDVWVACASKPYGLRIEKVMSGLYLGEVVRRLLLRLVERHGLLGPGDGPPGLQHGINRLTTPHVAKIHADDTLDLSATADVLQEAFGIAFMPLRARKMVQRICVMAATRSAQLLAVSIAALLRMTGRDGDAAPRTVVAIDGGMYDKYHAYRDTVKQALEELLGATLANKVEIRLTPDGSSLGAAGLAAAAVRDGGLLDRDEAGLRTLSMAPRASLKPRTTEALSKKDVA